jgi:hypothetical protein
LQIFHIFHVLAHFGEKIPHKSTHRKSKKYFRFILAFKENYEL